MKYRDESNLDVEDIRRVFEYDPETGDIRRRAGRVGGGEYRVGVRIYRFVTYRGKSYCVHRIAWAITYGHFPDSYIDHINGDKHDNRLENLRLATKGQNNTNQRRKTKSGRKGVLERAGKFIVQMKIEGKLHRIYNIETLDEAAHEYNKLAVKHHGEFAILNPIGEPYV